jgi:hypothetical protein
VIALTNVVNRPWHLRGDQHVNLHSGAVTERTRGAVTVACVLQDLLTTTDVRTRMAQFGSSPASRTFDGFVTTSASSFSGPANSGNASASDRKIGVQRVRKADCQPCPEAE